MVDLALLQSVSYIAGALGVCVAAFYYVMNLRVQQTNMREAEKNRKLTFTTNILQNLNSKESSRRWIDLMNMEWKDFDDFYKKYDSRVNPDNWADRNTWMGMLDLLGYQYRVGLIDLETVYQTSWTNVLTTWMKFKPIIDEYKKSDYAKDYYLNFEYLANALARLKKERDSSWSGPAGFFKADFDGTFFKNTGSQ
jgi:hypothetical protein